MRASQAAALNQTAAQAANQALPPAQAPAGSTTVQPPANVPGANLPGADTAQKLARQAPIDQVRPDMQMTVTAPKPTVMTPKTGDLFASGNVVQGQLPQNVNPVGGGVGGTPPAAGQVAAQPTLEDALVKMQEDAAAAAGPERSRFYELPEPRSGIAGTQVGQRTAAGFDPESLRRPGFMESVKDMFAPVGDDFFKAGKKDLVKTQY